MVSQKHDARQSSFRQVPPRVTLSTSNIAKVFVFHIDALSLWTLDCTLTQVTRPRVHIFILERILSNGERHLVVGHRCRMSGVKLRLDFCGRQ